MRKALMSRLVLSETIMDWTQILKRPFIIPSLIAGLIVAFRIFMLFFQYALKKIRRRKEEEARKRARGAGKNADGIRAPSDGM